jgi:hypothetical protein
MDKTFILFRARNIKILISHIIYIKENPKSHHSCGRVRPMLLGPTGSPVAQHSARPAHQQVARGTQEVALQRWLTHGDDPGRSTTLFTIHMDTIHMIGWGWLVSPSYEHYLYKPVSSTSLSRK